MKMAMSCGCCGVKNCIKLWTPRRIEGDTCDWLVDVGGNLTLPHGGRTITESSIVNNSINPLHSLKNLKRTTNTVLDEGALDGYGNRTHALVASTDAPAWSVSYSARSDLEVSASLPLDWAEIDVPSCVRSRQLSKTNNGAWESLPLGTYSPPPTITAVFDRIGWRANAIFDSVLTVTCPTGVDGSGPSTPVQVFYNSVAGLSPVSGYANGVWEWEGVYTGYTELYSTDGIAEELDETTGEIKHGFSWEEESRFQDGECSFTLNDVTESALLRASTFAYRSDGAFEILAADSGVTSGFLGTKHWGPQNSLYSTSRLGPSKFTPMGTPLVNAVYAGPLFTAMGETLTEGGQYVLAVRTLVPPENEELEFLLPQVKYISYGPGLYIDEYLSVGGYLNNTCGWLMTLEQTFGLQPHAVRSGNATATHDDSLRMAGSTNDKLWTKRDEFSFPLTIDESVPTDITGTLTATRNGCSLA